MTSHDSHVDVLNRSFLRNDSKKLPFLSWRVVVCPNGFWVWVHQIQSPSVIQNGSSYQKTGRLELGNAQNSKACIFYTKKMPQISFASTESSRQICKHSQTSPNQTTTDLEHISPYKKFNTLRFSLQNTGQIWQIPKLSQAHNVARTYPQPWSHSMCSLRIHRNGSSLVVFGPTFLSKLGDVPNEAARMMIHHGDENLDRIHEVHIFA